MRWTVAAVVLAAATGLAVADDAVPKLDGTYTVIEILIDGKPSPKAKEVKAVEIKDGTITIKDGEREEGAKFKLDASKKPAEIDITPIKGSNEMVAGIYQAKATTDGLELTIAFAKNGGPRPTDFKGQGKDEVVLKLLRKK
ncbi:MAG TPA: TIGR03067 domain-containing protein [Gemmataceae bacterium]|nr:TIGR03067 domain-containing protein [Gemmataceae bacterium]